MSRRGRYGTIWEGFWPWAKAHGLSDAAKAACAFLVSTRHGDSSGAVELPALYLAHEQGWELAKAEAVLLEVERSGFAVRVGDWLMVRDYPEHYPPTNPKHAAGIAARVRALPSAIRALCASRWMDIAEARESMEKHGERFLIEFASFAEHAQALCKPSASPSDSLSKGFAEPIETLPIPDSGSGSVSGSGSESGSGSGSESDLPSGDHSLGEASGAADESADEPSEPPRTRKPRGPAPGLARLIAVQRALGGEAIDSDPGLGVAYAKVRKRGDDVLEAAVRRAWREDPNFTAIRSLRWLLSNLDRWLAPNVATLPGMPMAQAPPPRGRTRFERERAAFAEVIAEARAAEAKDQEPIAATDVRRTP